MELREFIAAANWHPLKIGDAEFAELACRVQIGTPMSTVLDELMETIYVQGLPRTGILGYPGVPPNVTAPAVGRETGPWEQANPSSGVTIPSSGEKIAVPVLPRSQEEKANEIRKIYDFYHQLCDTEYAQIPKPYRDSFEEKGGLEYYRSQRPFLFNSGIMDPPSFFVANIRTSVRFMDDVFVLGGAAQELIDRLDEAKKFLESIPIFGKSLKEQIIKSIPEKGRSRRRVIGGWDPRPIIGEKGPTSMGPHYPGLAVDINASTNEHLQGNRAKAIDAVLDHLTATAGFSASLRISKPIADPFEIQRHPDKAMEIGTEIWTGLSAISGAFTGFLKDNLDKYKAKQTLDPEVKKLLDQAVAAYGSVAKLEAVAKQGTFDLNLVVIVALVVGTNGQMLYGGQFAESKDQHHFQVSNWNRNFKQPKCVEDWIKKKGKAKE